MQPIVLIVDDQATEREAVARIFRRENVQTQQAGSGEEALKILEKEPVAAVLTDLKMPSMSGHELLSKVKKARPNVQIIVMSGYGSIEDAVSAMQAGALDFLEKPLNIEAARARVQKALEKHELERQNEALQSQLDTAFGLENMIGRSSAMRSVYQEIRRVAPTSATVLIMGESGTGKELAARAVHNLSPRRERRFLAFNCAAVTRELVESELFGYMRGAFTGAARDKPGYFEEADGGTLLLDEIGEMTLDAQAKLLRVLEEKEIMRVGGTRPIPIDARILASTNRDLEKAAAEGEFREDLFHRLNVFPITMPPLRDRRGDIPILIEHFLEKAIEELGVAPKRMDEATARILQARRWTGNVRQLRNTVQYLALNVDGSEIRPSDLPDAPTQLSSKGAVFQVGMRMEEIEKMAIMETLEAAGGNKSEAARILGIGLRTLYRKLEQMDGQDEDGAAALNARE